MHRFRQNPRLQRPILLQRLWQLHRLREHPPPRRIPSTFSADPQRPILLKKLKNRLGLQLHRQVQKRHHNRLHQTQIRANQRIHQKRQIEVSSHRSDGLARRGRNRFDVPSPDSEDRLRRSRPVRRQRSLSGPISGSVLFGTRPNQSGLHRRRRDLRRAEEKQVEEREEEDRADHDEHCGAEPLVPSVPLREAVRFEQDFLLELSCFQSAGFVVCEVQDQEVC